METKETKSSQDDTAKKKRPEVSERKRKSKGQETIALKCCLSTICTTNRLQAKINEVVSTMTQITFEGVKLLNLFALKWMESSNNPLEINQSLIEYMFRVVSTMNRNEKPVKGDKPDWSALKKKVQDTYGELYAPQRPAELKIQKRDNLAQFIACAAREYQTNAMNHVLTNFERRTKQWIRYKLHVSLAQRKLNPDRKDREAVIGRIFRCCIEQSGTLNNILLFNECNILKNDKDLTIWAMDVVSQIRSHLQFSESNALQNALFPVRDRNLKKYWWAFLPWLHVIQRTFDTPESQCFKGNRLFTLLPEYSYKPRYIHIDTRGLLALARIVDKNRVKKFLNQCRPPSDEKEKKKKPLKVSDYQSELWKNWFDLDALRSGANKQFAFCIGTDGLATSVVFTRPRSDQSSDENGLSWTDKQNNDWSNSLDQKVCSAKIKKRRTRFIGLDPGRRDVFTAVTDMNKDVDIIRCSNAEYYTLNGFRKRLHKQRLWMEEKNVNQNGLNMTQILLGMPSSCVSSVKAYQKHLSYALRYFHRVQSFFSARRQKRLRWSTYMKQKQALSYLCFRLTGGRPRQTVVAFGAAGFSASSPGHATAGKKNIKRCLRQCGVQVIDIDEYLTSQICSNCHQRKLAVCRYKRIEIKPNIAKTESKEDKVEIKMEDDVKSASRRVGVHGVRVCQNCHIVWNRDVNAARNILSIFHYLRDTKNQGLRPVCFQRSADSMHLDSKSARKRKREPDATNLVNTPKRPKVVKA